MGDSFWSLKKRIEISETFSAERERERERVEIFHFSIIRKKVFPSQSLTHLIRERERERENFEKTSSNLSIFLILERERDNFLKI